MDLRSSRQNGFCCLFWWVDLRIYLPAEWENILIDIYWWVGVDAWGCVQMLWHCWFIIILSSLLPLLYWPSLAVSKAEAPHWMKSIHQLTESDGPVTTSRLPFAQQFQMTGPSSGWPPHMQNPPPGFRNPIRPSNGPTETHKLAEGGHTSVLLFWSYIFTYPSPFSPQQPLSQRPCDEVVRLANKLMIAPLAPWLSHTSHLAHNLLLDI